MSSTAPTVRIALLAGVDTGDTITVHVAGAEEPFTGVLAAAGAWPSDHIIELAISTDTVRIPVAHVLAVEV